MTKAECDNDKQRHVPSRWMAERLFGEMRPSTDEEMALYRQMLELLSHPLPMKGIFDDGFEDQTFPIADELRKEDGDNIQELDAK